MKRVLVTHPDLSQPVSLRADRAEWLLSRDNRYQVVEQKPLLAKLQKDVGNEGAIEGDIGATQERKGNRRGEKAGGTD